MRIDLVRGTPVNVTIVPQMKVRSRQGTAFMYKTRKRRATKLLGSSFGQNVDDEDSDGESGFEEGYVEMHTLQSLKRGRRSAQQRHECS